MQRFALDLFVCIYLGMKLQFYSFRRYLCRSNTCSSVSNCENIRLHLVRLWPGGDRARRASHACLVQHMVRRKGGPCFFLVAACSGLDKVIPDARCASQYMVCSVFQLTRFHCFSHVVSVLISSGVAFVEMLVRVSAGV